MLTRRSIPATLSVGALALCAPPPALAQSAGDIQYQDPFGPGGHKARAGQVCNPHKKAPKGFKCTKHGRGKSAKYRLAKRKR